MTGFFTPGGRGQRMLKLFPLLIVILAGCAAAGLTLDDDSRYGKTDIRDHRVTAGSAATHYRQQIQPLLEQRCVVCHGCYDAPCQLKLSSADGIMRGANKEKVYDGTRILASQPTRLGIDAQTTAGWRELDFHPVLNERRNDAAINLENSVLYRMLALKARNPLPATTLLDDDDFTLDLNRTQQCPTSAEFAAFADDHPLWGMPYALPGLKESEFSLLTAWLRDGAPMASPPDLPPAVQEQVTVWERFLNGRGNKQQLTSRYLYEHLFLASLYFSDTPLFSNASYGTPDSPRPAFWFKLIRSATPPGKAVVPVASRRPYDDPGVARVYYRLVADHSSVVAKTHMPYELSDERLQWLKSLFIEPEYEVSRLPGYDTATAANPFIAFEQLPVDARYRFMLQEARYTITDFIKGPVCRGQVALNVIDDHFWVFFVSPEQQDGSQYAHFLRSQSKNLRLPGEAESNATFVTDWVEYSWLHDDYLDAKNKALASSFPQGRPPHLDLVWDGDGHNPNAALTILRHFDSSSVVQGMVGQPPKTAWLIDYSLLERIHYLLVAEFDVYGNIGHQLLTRLYMDFLRMEGEYNFLTLLPQQERIRLADYWYRDTSERVKKHLVNYEEHVLADPDIDYTSEQPQQELYEKLRQRLSPSLADKYSLPRHTLPGQLQSMLPLQTIRGRPATLMPELSLLMVDNMHGGSEVFTLIRNSGHSNLTSLLYEEDNRLADEDYLTLVPGVLGAYPSAFFRLSGFRLDDFVSSVKKLEDDDDYEKLMDRFGVRRTNAMFWRNSDDIHEWYRRHDPLNYGLLDYNRLENR